MMKDFSYYCDNPGRLDELSVTDLEILGQTFPFDQALQLLLVSKLAGYDNPVRLSTLNISDRSMVSPEYLRLSHNQYFSELSEKDTNNDYSGNQALVYPEAGHAGYVHIDPNEDTSAISHFINVPDSATGLYEDNSKSIKSDEQNIDASHTDNSDMNRESDSVNRNINMNKENSSEPKLISQTEKNAFSPNKVIEASDPINEVDYSVDISGKKKKKKTKKKKADKFRLTDYEGLSEYTLWLKGFSGENSEKSKKSKKVKYSGVLESVKKSVQKSETIISEPLAQILASQGHISEALKMYHQLMMKYPEKSVYFAARIDELLKSKEE